MGFPGCGSARGRPTPAAAAAPGAHRAACLWGSLLTSPSRRAGRGIHGHDRPRGPGGRRIRGSAAAVCAGGCRGGRRRGVGTGAPHGSPRRARGRGAHPRPGRRRAWGPPAHHAAPVLLAHGGGAAAHARSAWWLRLWGRGLGGGACDLRVCWCTARWQAVPAAWQPLVHRHRADVPAAPGSHTEKV